MIVELYSKRARVLKLEQTANSQCDGMAVHQMCESSRQIQTASSQCGGTAVYSNSTVVSVTLQLYSKFPVIPRL